MRRRWPWIGLVGARPRRPRGDVLPPAFVQAAYQLEGGVVEEETVICEVARSYVGVDTNLSGFLDDLDTTYRALGWERPSRELVRAAVEAWADELSGRFDSISCQDPLTGLATIHHLRTRLADLYGSGMVVRPAGSRTFPWLLLVTLPVELPARKRRGCEAAIHPVERALHLAVIGHVMRGVVAGIDTLAAVGAHTAVAIVYDADMDRGVAHLIEVLQSRPDTGWSTEADVRVLALPSTIGEARRLIDRLRRFPGQDASAAAATSGACDGPPTGT